MVIHSSRVVRAALAALAACVARLPWRALGVPGTALGGLAGSVLRIRRRLVEEAMARAGVLSPANEARRMYDGLGRGVFELLWLAGSSASRRDGACRDHVVFAPGALEALDAALARGPVLVGASHTGNWELTGFAAARALASRGRRRLVVVAKPLAATALDGFMRTLREALGLVTLAPRGAAKACLDRLEGGDVVVMPLDQVPDAVRHGMRVGVLGAPAWVDRAPAVLAARAGATLLVVASSRKGPFQVVHVLEAIDARACDVREVTARATRALEAFVERHPAGWLWLHRRWREPRRRGAPALSRSKKDCIEIA